MILPRPEDAIHKACLYRVLTGFCDNFFISGYRYSKEVILERRNISNVKSFFIELSKFINNNITETVITQDLNMLLPYEQFKRVRKILKQETMIFLNDEIKRIDKM